MIRGAGPPPRAAASQPRTRGPSGIANSISSTGRGRRVPPGGAVARCGRNSMRSWARNATAGTPSTSTAARRSQPITRAGLSPGSGPAPDALRGLKRVDRLLRPVEDVGHGPALEAGVGVDLGSVMDLVLDHHHEQAPARERGAGGVDHLHATGEPV